MKEYAIRDTTILIEFRLKIKNRAATLIRISVTRKNCQMSTKIAQK